jgi:hypothetical protein
MIQKKKEIKGILLFCSPECLEHKKRDGIGSEGNYCYWTTRKYPTTIAKGEFKADRIYFAVRGKVKGYFIMNDIKQIDDDTWEFRWFSETWVDIEDGKCFKLSQGWRHYTE